MYGVDAPTLSTIWSSSLCRAVAQEPDAEASLLEVEQQLRNAKVENEKHVGIATMVRMGLRWENVTKGAGREAGLCPNLQVGKWVMAAAPMYRNWLHCRRVTHRP